MNTATINGKVYKLQFQHINLESRSDRTKGVEKIGKAFLSALDSGQVSLHAWDYGVDRKHANFGCLFSGATICDIEDGSRNVLATGYAFCSQKDQFCKKIGRQVAFGRAKAQL